MEHLNGVGEQSAIIYVLEMQTYYVPKIVQCTGQSGNEHRASVYEMEHQCVLAQFT